MLIFELKWAKTYVLPLAVACTLHVCAVSSQVQVQLPQKLLKISTPNSFILPSAKLLNDTAHYEPALCGSHMNLIMAQLPIACQVT